MLLQSVQSDSETISIALFDKFSCWTWPTSALKPLDIIFKASSLPRSFGFYYFIFFATLSSSRIALRFAGLGWVEPFWERYIHIQVSDLHLILSSLPSIRFFTVLLELQHLHPFKTLVRKKRESGILGKKNQRAGKKQLYGDSSRRRSPLPAISISLKKEPTQRVSPSCHFAWLYLVKALLAPLLLAFLFHRTLLLLAVRKENKRVAFFSLFTTPATADLHNFREAIPLTQERWGFFLLETLFSPARQIPTFKLSRPKIPRSPPPLESCHCLLVAFNIALAADCCCCYLLRACYCFGLLLLSIATTTATTATTVTTTTLLLLLLLIYYYYYCCYQPLLPTTTSTATTTTTTYHYYYQFSHSFGVLFYLQTNSQCRAHSTPKQLSILCRSGLSTANTVSTLISSAVHQPFHARFSLFYRGGVEGIYFLIFSFGRCWVIGKGWGFW